jgi:hypothetical protein
MKNPATLSDFPRRVGLLVVTTALLVLPASPAHADIGSVTALSDEILYEVCTEQLYTFSMQPAEGYDDYNSIEVIVIAPDGREVGKVLQKDVGTAGSGKVTFCSRTPGQYILLASGESCSQTDCYIYDLLSDTFSARLPHTRTTLTAAPTKPRVGQTVAFKVTTSDEQPGGYFPTESATVVLQSKSSKGWSNVKGGKATAVNGAATLKANYVGGRRQFRAVTLQSKEAGRSVSRTITISQA